MVTQRAVARGDRVAVEHADRDDEARSDLAHSANGNRPDAGYQLVVPLRSLLFIAAVVVATLAAAVFVDRARTVLGAVALATTFALLAEPLVRRLRSVLPHGIAVATTVLGVLGVVVTGLTFVVRDIDRQVGRMRESLVAVIDNFEPGSTPARVADALDAESRIGTFFDSLALRTVVGGDDAGAVAEQLGRALLVTVLAGFLLFEGGSAVDAAIRMARKRSTRRALHRRARVVRDAAGSFTRRMLVVSLGHGVIAALVAVVLDLPAPVSLGAWAAVLSTVPLLGGIAAWAPTVALGSLDDRVTLVTVALVGVVVVLADATVRHRWASSRLHAGSLLPAVGIALGFVVGGLAGSLVGLYAAAALAAAVGPASAAAPEGPGEDLVEFVDQAEIQGDHEPVIAAVPDEQPARGIVHLAVSPRTVMAAGCLALLLWCVYIGVHEAGPFMIWGTLGLLIAVGLDRPVTWIARRVGAPRAVAIAGLLLPVLAAFAVLGAAFGPRASDATSSIAADAPETVESLGDLPLVGSALRDSDASARLERWIEELPDRVAESGTVERVASFAGDATVGVMWTAVIAIAALLDGPHIVSAVCARVPARSRRTATVIGRAAYTALSRYAGGAAFVAALNGAVVFLIGLLLGVPLAPVLAVWAAAWNFIPQIGGLVGGSPLIVLAFAEGPIHGVIAAAAFVTYQTFENHVIQPAVIGKTISIPAWVALVGALMGGALFGFLGAIVAAPAMGVARVLLIETRERQARIDDDVEGPRVSV